MYLFFTVLCRAPSLHWSILNNELHLSGSRLYGMVLVYGMADSCLYNKQNNTWTLGDMEFIFSCSHSISHSFAALTCSISMWTLEDKFHISARPCIILYLSKLGDTKIETAKPSDINTLSSSNSLARCFPMSIMLVDKSTPSTSTLKF